MEDKVYKPIKIGAINNIDKDLYIELKDSYYGGHVDMYIPAGPIAESKGFANPEDQAIVPHNNKYVYHYDINSLYPSAMKQFKYPNKLFGKFASTRRLGGEAAESAGA